MIGALLHVSAAGKMVFVILLSIFALTPARADARIPTGE